MGKQGRHKGGGRVTPKGTRPANFQPRHRDDEGPWAEPDDLGLMRDVRRAIRADHPLELLALVSSLVGILDPRTRRDPFARDHDEPEVSREQLLASFAEIDRLETSVLLAVLGALGADDAERDRIDWVLAGRTHPMPSWLTTLEHATAQRAVTMTHVLGDGDNVMVGVRMPSGHDLTAVVYIDHNMGTVLKDAFVLPDSVDGVVTRYAGLADAHTAFSDLPLADAKVRITEAIALNAMMFPPLGTDTWPAARALVEWMVGRLPEGGQGYERPEWSEAQRAGLSARFLASPFAAGVRDDDQRDLVETLVWFGCDYGPGDPLRWSPVSVELLLADWLPRKVVAPVRHLAKAPDVLRAFIRFAHAERAVPEDLTAQTLGAVDHWETDYQATIRTPRPQGPEALLAAMGALNPEGPWPQPDDDWEAWDNDEADWEEDRTLADVLADALGSRDALAALDDDPLPDEPFAWDGIPEDLHERVREVLALTDRCCDELLDVEHRTAVRRVLARIARQGPDALRRRGKPDTAAAALCWAVARANRYATDRDSVPQKAFLDHLGLSSPVSSRARTLLEAGGFAFDTYELTLGSPDYLVGGSRRRLMQIRDRFGSS